jgi:hypothetical protein
MKALTLSACLTLLCANTAASASTIVTFEDVAITYGSSPLYGTANLLDGYAGISGWNGIGQAWGTPAGSGLNEAIDNQWFYGSEGELVFDHAPVIFEGAYYKSYAADPSAPVTSIELYYQGNLVHSILDPRASSSLVWLASGYNGFVDKVLIRGGVEGFAIDNLTYTIAAVPEPATTALLFSGMAMVAMSRRHKKHLGHTVD